MNIVVIGTGSMGSTFIKKLAQAGHTIGVVSRNIERAREFEEMYTHVYAYKTHEIPGDFDVILNAVNFVHSFQALRAIGSLAGKVLVDICNPLDVEGKPLFTPFNISAAEQFANAFPGAAVIKAFNTVCSQMLNDGPFFGGHQGSVFTASDSYRATQCVSSIAQSMGWKSIDVGPLKHAYHLESLACLSLYVERYGRAERNIPPDWIWRRKLVTR